MIRFVSMMALSLAGVPLSALAESRTPQRLPMEDPAIKRLASEELRTFESEAAFKAWLRQLRKVNDARDYAQGRTLEKGAQFAQAEQTETCADPQNCPAEDTGDQNIMVTASKATSSKNPSITNNQNKGVEEGDIVKQIDQYLIVLQDGRLFAINTKAGDGHQLALADRMDVYRDSDDDMWYDEMLVHGDRITVTGYSYEEEATELSVFKLAKDGSFAREGTFYVSSNDYYSAKNYASRLIGNKLIIYTPVYLRDVDLDEPLAWPLVRRWLPKEEREKAKKLGKPLFDARQIYRPVQPSVDPMIHTISVCTLGDDLATRNLPCRSTALVGPARKEMLATTTDVFLWTTPGWQDVRFHDDKPACAPGSRAAAKDAWPATLYRIPVSGDAPTALGTRGAPIDQFSLESSHGQFRALVGWGSLRCDLQDNDGGRLAYFSAPLSAFDAVRSEAGAARYTALPWPDATRVENRFTDQFLVYGGRKTWGTEPPEDEEEGKGKSGQIVAVPVNKPARHVSLEVPHNVIRLERAGDNIILTGYRDDTGLGISQIDLRRAPRLASSVTLPHRFESEGRSHAFNSLIEETGAGIMGLPTVKNEDDTGRYFWRSDASDVSFLVTDPAGQLRTIGALELGEGDNAEEDDDYECEVSCIDWYGNSRPIFTDGRVFGLSGTSLIEGKLVKGEIRELQRINLTTGFNDPKKKVPPPPTPPVKEEEWPDWEWFSPSR